MAYSVDYSGDWQFVEGMELVTFTPQGGTAIDDVPAKRGDVTNPDFGGQFGLSPTSLPWTLWRGGAVNVGDLITTTDNVVYAVTAILGKRPDGSQTTVQALKRE